MPAGGRYFNLNETNSEEAAQKTSNILKDAGEKDDDEDLLNGIDVSKYKRFSRIKPISTKSKYLNARLENQQLKAANAVTRAAVFDSIPSQASIGGIVTESIYESTLSLNQWQIVEQSSLNTNSKFFELYLPQHGPYHARFSSNGNQLLLAGQLGHVSNIQWKNKNLVSELNVAERINDCCWLTNTDMFAVAQKYYTHVYDKKGTELHCLKQLDNTLAMSYLPYHFVLAAINDRNYLSYYDISIGKHITSYRAYSNKSVAMCQNRASGIINLAHSNGVVSLWSPNNKEQLASILCHNAGLTSISVSLDGTTMLTTSVNKKASLWDLRSYKCLQKIKLEKNVETITKSCFSQTDMIAFGAKSNILTLRMKENSKYEPYLKHSITGAAVNTLEFCPYEDVLGIGHSLGFNTMIVPGSCNPNFDSMEANPIQSRSRRQNQEVSRLIEKIPVELIDIDNGAIGKVNVKSLREQIIERNSVTYLKKKRVEVKKPKFKTRGKSKAAHKESRKQMEFGKQILAHKKSIDGIKQPSDKSNKNTDSKNKKFKKDPLEFLK